MIRDAFAIEKTASEIRAAASAKQEQIEAKVAEREARVTKLRADYGIDDKALVALLTEARRRDHSKSIFTYTSTSNSTMPGQPDEDGEERTIGAGVVEHLLTENDLIAREKKEAEDLARLVRNIRPLQRHTESGVAYEGNAFCVSSNILEYLGF